MSAGRRRAFWQRLDPVPAQAGASGWRSTHLLQSELQQHGGSGHHQSPQQPGHVNPGKALSTSMPASFASLDPESETRRKRYPHRFSRCGKRSKKLPGSAIAVAAASTRACARVRPSEKSALAVASVRLEAKASLRTSIRPVPGRGARPGRARRRVQARSPRRRSLRSRARCCPRPRRRRRSCSRRCGWRRSRGCVSAGT